MVSGIPFSHMKNLWLVVNKKSGKCIDLCHTRDIARDVKARHGGSANNVSIVKFIPVEEIR